MVAPEGKASLSIVRLVFLHLRFALNVRELNGCCQQRIMTEHEFRYLRPTLIDQGSSLVCLIVCRSIGQSQDSLMTVFIQINSVNVELD